MLFLSSSFELWHPWLPLASVCGTLATPNIATKNIAAPNITTKNIATQNIATKILRHQIFPQESGRSDFFRLEAHSGLLLLLPELYSYFIHGHLPEQH